MCLFGKHPSYALIWDARSRKVCIWSMLMLLIFGPSKPNPKYREYQYFFFLADFGVLTLVFDRLLI